MNLSMGCGLINVLSTVHFSLNAKQERTNHQNIPEHREDELSTGLHTVL